MGNRKDITIGMLRRSLADQDVELPLVFVQPGRIASFQWEAIREETAIVIDRARDRDVADIAHVRTVGTFLGALAALPDECELRFRPAASAAALFPVVLVELREASTGSSPRRRLHVVWSPECSKEVVP
jgi:hypothetical protein